MPQPKILASRTLPPAVEQRARQSYQFVSNAHDTPYDSADLCAAAQGCDGLIVTPTDRLDAAAIAALPETVRIVATFSVGTDHIDLEAAKARGLVITNTPDVLTEATAEIALLLMLGAARRAPEGMAMIGQDAWPGWSPTQLVGQQLSGKRLGVMGMGRIGQAVADLARAFGMTIHYHNRRRLSPELEKGAQYHADAEQLLAVSDVLTLHCPATPETVGFLDARRIALLPPGAIVVNTARGPVIDEPALMEALRSGQVAAAGLDVFIGEPVINPAWRQLPNVMLLPHLGSATETTRNAMGFRVLDNLDAFFATGQPPHRV
jgi:lactate dehydrogenase-like 2-hydroxyacid dehydrogenase